MNRKILNAAFVGAMLLIAIMVLLLILKPDEKPAVSEAEADARLKVAENARENVVFETTKDITELEIQHMEAEAYDHEPVTEMETETFAEEEVYYPAETYADFPAEPEEIDFSTETELVTGEIDFSEELSSEEETEEPTTEGNPWGFTDEEVWEIARITYLENGCEGYYYPTYLTACVILNRYLDWGYESITDVIFAPGQYTTAYRYTNWSGGELVISDMTWQAVYDALADPDRNPHYQMNGGSGNLYYRHPETGECFYY